MFNCGMRARVAIAVALLLVGLATFNYLRPIPAVAAAVDVPATTTVEGAPPDLPWPATGSAAVAAAGLGLIASSGNETPIAAASVTKVMTALLVLTDKPMVVGDEGPTITLTEADVAAYQAAVANGESNVPVEAGEQLTELKALEALLIPSANNIAITLARWNAGSLPAFVAKMNAQAKALGMTHTTFADASGASPQSVSTPPDLVKLGIEAMRLPVFALVVGLPSASLPVAGTVYNVNSVLGKGGIIGIKTGSGLKAGANFLYAASVQVGTYRIVLYGCVMGQPTLAKAFAVALALVAAMQKTVTVHRVVSRNQTIGAFAPPWGGHADLVANVDVDLVEWPGMVLRQDLSVPDLVITQPIGDGANAGSLHLTLGDYRLTVPLVMAGALYPPGRVWRLTRLS